MLEMILSFFFGELWDKNGQKEMERAQEILLDLMIKENGFALVNLF